MMASLQTLPALQAGLPGLGTEEVELFPAFKHSGQPPPAAAVSMRGSHHAPACAPCVLFSSPGVCCVVQMKGGRLWSRTRTRTLLASSRVRSWATMWPCLCPRLLSRRYQRPSKMQGSGRLRRLLRPRPLPHPLSNRRRLLNQPSEHGSPSCFALDCHGAACDLAVSSMPGQY